MTTFNASPKMQSLRLESYQYVDLHPKDVVMKGIPVGPEGAELHHDNGRVIACRPGDWVVEFPDGSLQRMSADVVLELYEIPTQAKTANAPEELQAHGVAHPHAAAVAAAQSTTEHTDDGGFIPIAGEDERVTETRRRRALAEPGVPMSAAEKAQAEQDIADYARKARGLAIKLSTQAIEAGLIDRHEQQSWVDTGVAPDGVTVTAADDGAYVITRIPQDVEPEEDLHEEEIEGAEGEGLAPTDPEATWDAEDEQKAFPEHASAERKPAQGENTDTFGLPAQGERDDEVHVEPDAFDLTKKDVEVEKDPAETEAEKHPADEDGVEGAQPADK